MSADWLRSARCESGNCVEVAWMKSEQSGADGCVEVAEFAGDVLVRDSKLGESGPVLRFNWAEWRAFVDGIEALDASLASCLPSGT